jgi:hypothetical protein
VFAGLALCVGLSGLALAATGGTAAYADTTNGEQINLCNTDIYTHEYAISGINQNGDYVVAQYPYTWTGIAAGQCETFYGWWWVGTVTIQREDGELGVANVPQTWGSDVYNIYW